jgi:sorting nexin-29
MLSVDFKQAFDNVNRKKLIEAMNKMRIQHKIIRMVEMTLNHTKARVKIGSKLSETFEFSVGVKQRDGLSAVLFILALHHAVNKIHQRGSIFPKSSQICAYADDIVIVTRSKCRLIQMYEELAKEAEEMGLIIDENKTKYMAASTSESRRKLQSKSRK